MRLQPPLGAVPCDARHGDPAICTALLWLFSLLIYLPVVIERDAREGAHAARAVVVDNLIIILAMLIVALLFAASGATFARPEIQRVAMLAAALVAAAIVQSIGENVYWGLVLLATGMTWPIADVLGLRATNA